MATVNQLSAISDSQPPTLGNLYDSSGEDTSDDLQAFLTQVPKVKKRKPKTPKMGSGLSAKKRKRPVLTKLNFQDVSAAAAAAAKARQEPSTPHCDDDNAAAASGMPCWPTTTTITTTTNPTPNTPEEEREEEEEEEDQEQEGSVGSIAGSTDVREGNPSDQKLNVSLIVNTSDGEEEEEQEEEEEGDHGANGGGGAENEMPILPVAPCINARQGVTYLCTDAWRTNSGMYEQLIGVRDTGIGRNKISKLFYPLGGGLHLEKGPSRSFRQGDDRILQERLRMSLWYPSGSGHMEKAAGRYSVIMDYDALSILSVNLKDIDKALSLSDSVNFLGFALHIGNRWFVTVQRDDQRRVDIRRWWTLDSPNEDPLPELLPSRDGLKMNQAQFRRFKLFLQSKLAKVFPTFAKHVFVCDQPEHVSAVCTYCRPPGILPMQRKIHSFMSSGELCPPASK